MLIVDARILFVDVMSVYFIIVLHHRYIKDWQQRWAAWDIIMPQAMSCDLTATLPLVHPSSTSCQQLQSCRINHVALFCNPQPIEKLLPLQWNPSAWLMSLRSNTDRTFLREPREIRHHLHLFERELRAEICMKGNKWKEKLRIQCAESVMGERWTLKYFY